jgi:glycosyltransferase involved in cell wall biosynthesis
MTGGTVLIEALPCGTPVLAYRRGSIPEIIEDRVSHHHVSDHMRTPVTELLILRHRYGVSAPGQMTYNGKQ